MLRFCSGGENLIEYVFDVVIDQSGQAKCEQIWPEEACDPAILKSIGVFVYPDPSAVESRQIFNFVLGDTAVDYHHGFIYYENCKKATCILTKFYYPLIFKKVLINHSADIKEFANSLFVPENSTQIQIDDTSFPLDGSVEKQRLYGLIFRTFSAYDVTKIIIGMLESRHVFPICASPSMLCQFSAALPLLLEPFRWNMNTIPVLPTKLKDVANVPVPTMIGLTHPEILLEGRIDNHIIVNIDTHKVIDNPPFDLEDPQLMNVLNLQLQFHTKVNMELRKWQKIRNFPYKHIQKIVKSFIAKYIFLYTGEVRNVEQLVESHQKMPERLRDSQVLHDLEQLDQITPELRKQFDEFFAEIFEGKIHIATPQRGQSSPQVGKAIPKSSSSTFVKMSSPTKTVTQSISTNNMTNDQSLSDPFGFNNMPTNNPPKSPSQNFDLLGFNQPPPTSVDDLFGFSTGPPKQQNSADILLGFEDISSTPSNKSSADILFGFDDSVPVAPSPVEKQTFQNSQDLFANQPDLLFDASPNASQPQTPKEQSPQISNNSPQIQNTNNLFNSQPDLFTESQPQQPTPKKQTQPQQPQQSSGDLFSSHPDLFTETKPQQQQPSQLSPKPKVQQNQRQAAPNKGQDLFSSNPELFMESTPAPKQQQVPQSPKSQPPQRQASQQQQSNFFDFFAQPQQQQQPQQQMPQRQQSKPQSSADLLDSLFDQQPQVQPSPKRTPPGSSDLFDPFTDVSKPPQQNNDFFDMGRASTKQADPYSGVAKQSTPQNSSNQFDFFSSPAQQPQNTSNQNLFDPFSKLPAAPDQGKQEFNFFGDSTSQSPQKPANPIQKDDSSDLFDPFASLKKK